MLSIEIIKKGIKEMGETTKDTTALRLKDIVKVYGDGENGVKALKGINLSFRKSEFVSVLGPSGCGKTTLLNIVGGLDRYTTGDLIINGVSTKEYKDGDWDTYRNDSVGFVFQSYNLISHQTVLSNVELALTLSGVSNAERKKRAKDVLERVGLKDQAYKRPNQLSGGQMQRVAIARALVNDPDIILADEPTGALDTETSLQVMEILKEISADRLVIMVTHNPDLAKKYSTRIINLLDGEVTGDTDPLDVNEKESAEKPVKTNGNREKESKPRKKKSAMNLFTAFALSFSNLRTKKGRTTLTSIAGSIGIIGIALVLAVSTGFSAYINELQADTLSTYPLTITEATIDLSDFEKLTSDVISDDNAAERVKNKVYVKGMFEDLTNMLKSNKLSEEYIKYVEDYVDEKNKAAAKGDWAYCLKRGYGFDANDYIFTELKYNLTANGNINRNVMSINTFVQMMEYLFNEGLKYSNMNISAEFVRNYIPTVCEIPESRELIASQYEMLYGDWANGWDEMLLVVDRNYRVTDITLAVLGYKAINGLDGYNVTFDGTDSIDFQEIVNKKFYYIDNTVRYVYKENVFGTNFVSSMYAGEGSSTFLSPVPESAHPLKVTGIVRLKDDVQQGVLQTGLAYTSEFVKHILTDEGNLNSPIVRATDGSVNEDGTRVYDSVSVINPLINMEGIIKKYVNAAADVKWKPITYTRRALGGDDTVSKLSIYSRDYSAKEEIKTYLKAWNDKQTNEENIVHYSDSTAMLFSAMNSIVDAVKIVLIAFTAISLVVSSIMIGIITYVSVVERTKEIGVLRSLGARKKDISRIFNAETFLIGFFAGLIGVAVSYLLTIPINMIFAHFVSGATAIAVLKITDAMLLVTVSFVLTIIAGIIPSRIASRKDPVVALRTE